MPGRTTPIQTAADLTSAGTKPYRYGFNGKESDFEVKNIGGSQQDYGFRIYDPRLGRFLSVDPLANKYAGESPYSFAGNSPILFVDQEGKTKVTYTTIIDKTGNSTTIRTVDAKAIEKISYGSQLTMSGYHNQYEVEYDIIVNTTIDYSNLKNGKPTITTGVKLEERSFIKDVKKALWAYEAWSGTEAEGNPYIDNIDGDRDHGKFGPGERDPFTPDSQTKSKEDQGENKRKSTGQLRIEDQGETKWVQYKDYEGAEDSTKKTNQAINEGKKVYAEPDE